MKYEKATANLAEVAGGSTTSLFYEVKKRFERY